MNRFLVFTRADRHPWALTGHPTESLSLAVGAADRSVSLEDGPSDRAVVMENHRHRCRAAVSVPLRHQTLTTQEDSMADEIDETTPPVTDQGDGATGASNDAAPEPEAPAADEPATTE